MLGLDVLQAVHNPTPGSTGGVDQGAYRSRGDACRSELSTRRLTPSARPRSPNSEHEHENVHSHFATRPDCSVSRRARSTLASMNAFLDAAFSDAAFS